MAITLYRKDTGAQQIFAHIVDAKESMQSGFFTEQAPVLAKPELPAKSEAKPTVIPTVEDKKPAKVVEEKKPIVVEEDEKPAVKSTPRIIRK